MLSVDIFILLDKDNNGTLSKQELREYADGALTEIIIERGMHKNLNIHYLYKVHINLPKNAKK